MKDNCGVELVRLTTINEDTKDGKMKKVKVLRVTTYARTFLNGPQKRKSSTYASPRRMPWTLTNHPEINFSLKPGDVHLFTHCDDAKSQILNVLPRQKKPTSAQQRLTTESTLTSHPGTVRPAISSGFNRVLISVDDASRWIFITLLQNTTMGVIAAAMRAILRKVSGDESVLRNKIVRTDNGKEFCNRDVDALLGESDILRELTCVGTSHQNGVAERAIGIVFSMARTIIVDACLPPVFWDEAAITAVYICNRLPCMFCQL